MALQPTLVAPPQTSRVLPVGFGDVEGCWSASWSFWNNPQAAVDKPKGSTAALSYDKVLGMDDAALTRRTVYSWKAPCAGLLYFSSVPLAWPTTRSPTLKRVTPGPTSTTSPAVSKPRINGYLSEENIILPMSWIIQSIGLIATAP